jgi:hypothetical protein
MLRCIPPRSAGEFKALATETSKALTAKDAKDAKEMQKQKNISEIENLRLVVNLAPGQCFALKYISSFLFFLRVLGVPCGEYFS